MIFYCPNCRREYELEVQSKDITKSGRVAYKTACQICNQALVEFIPGEKATPPPEEPNNQ